MKSILLVDDCTEALTIVQRALGAGYDVVWAKTLSEAFERLNKKVIDLIILDVVLPDGDGYRLCSILQTDDRLKNIPVVFLTAKTAVADRILGFTLGADDYISKPFHSSEMKARIDARFRKRDRDRRQANVIKHQFIELDKTTQKVRALDHDDWIDVALTSIEFRLLLFLMTAQNEIHHRDEILDVIWGEDIHVYSRSVDTHISKLRRKLGRCAECIESVHGFGYRLVSADRVGHDLALLNPDEITRGALLTL